MILENVLFCGCWLWTCLSAEAVFVLFKNSRIHSLARFGWATRAVQLLCGAVWLLGTIQAGNFLSGSVRLPCAAWSLWLVRIFGACGWSAAFAYSLFEKWSSGGGPPRLIASTFVFAAALFFLMILPYSIQAGYHPDKPATASLPCFPTLFYEICPACFQLLVCALAARCVHSSDRHTLDLEVGRAAFSHDRRTKRACVAAALLVPLFSIPSNFQLGLDPWWSGAGAIGVSACVVLWSVVDALEPAYRFATDDIGFSAGFAAAATFEERCMYEMLESISPDKEGHLRLFMERCVELKTEDAVDEHGVHRPELLVRQFIKDRRLGSEFALFVAIMWRNDSDDLESRKVLTDAIISYFFVSQRLGLSEEAREIILSDASDTNGDYFFDNLVRILNGRFDMHRYKWKIQHDELYNKPILIEGLTPEAVLHARKIKAKESLSLAPSPRDTEREKTEREIEHFLVQNEQERRERNARFESRRRLDETFH